MPQWAFNHHKQQTVTSVWNLLYMFMDCDEEGLLMGSVSQDRARDLRRFISLIHEKRVERAVYWMFVVCMSVNSNVLPPCAHRRTGST